LFHAEFATVLRGEHMLMKLSLATCIWRIQQYEKETYEEIMR
jgi:hypothetical protein